MSFPLDDLASMALFAHVVRLQSFTAAARHVGLAKSAVSKRIASLEERTGVKLLRRTTRTLSLTDEGARFYAQCAKLVAAAQDAEECVVEAGRDVRGTLRLSAPVAFGQMYLVRALADFLAEYPGVDIELVMDDRFVDLVGSGMDAAVRITRLVDSSLVARRIATDRAVVVGSPSYFERLGVPETPNDLVHHHLMRYLLVPASSEWRFGSGRQQVVPPRVRFSSNDGIALREAAVAGVGLASLPWFMVAPAVASGALRTVLDHARDVELGIHVVYAHRDHVAKRLRALVDFLARRFKKVDWAKEAGLPRRPS